MRRFALAALCSSLMGGAVAQAVPLVPGDFNEDYRIDLVDFAAFQNQFNGRICARGQFQADLDGNGCVDILDYLVVFDAIAGTCADPGDCGVQSPADCKWKPIADARAANQCHLLPDSVDRRLCTLNILLNGNVADALAAGATSLVDTVPDEVGVSGGVTGDLESPRLPLGLPDPNGFNSARTLALFMPDSNPIDNLDDSFLYLGWDISNRVDDDGKTPSPFDSDDNGVAASLGTCPSNCAVSDKLPESYQVFIQGCAGENVFDEATGPLVLANNNPNEIQADYDSNLLMILVEVCTFPLRIVPTPAGQMAEAFPTADALTNRLNQCVDQEGVHCAAGNDVEIIIRAVETSGAFGPFPAPAADTAEAKANRFALAQLLASLHGASNGDESDEEIANVAVRKELPSLDVTKRARCAEAGQAEFTTQPIDALIGSTVEFELTIENTGNQDLEVTVADVLQEFGGQAAFAQCEVVCDSIAASLTSPRRGLVDFAVTFGNASTLPICDSVADPDCLNSEFFFASCDPPFAGRSFLESVSTGTSAVLGTLLGASVERVDSECQVTPGDKLVIRFRARVGTTQGGVGQFCTGFVDGDCRNSVTVTGTAVGQTLVVARDEAGTPDTVREIQGNNVDDNRVTIDILCRNITFSKFVGFPNDDQSFVTGTSELSVPSVPPAGFIDLEYLYIVDNTGEVDEQITLVDPLLCTDIAAVQSMHPGGVSLVNCPLCPSGQVGPFTLTPSGGTRADSCVIRFSQQAALRKFLALDNNRQSCNANDPGSSGDDCYRNCADANSTPINLNNICRPPLDVITKDSFTTICNAQCEILVKKEVRCLPNCNTSGLGPDAGWVEDPARLDVTPGACLQYRITARNSSAEPNPICALKFNDLMSDDGNFQSGPTNVQMIGRSCTNLTIADAFNWDGNDVICKLNLPLGSGQMLAVLFEARMKSQGLVDFNSAPANTCTVSGASEADCPQSGDPRFTCKQDDTVAIEIEECNLEVIKDVTCDDPRSPNAVFSPDIVDALPGSKVGFRIQVTNTGDVNLPRVNLMDVLSCASWFVPDSVSAYIEGDVVEDCICAGGCNGLADVNGLKDLTPCRPGGLATGEILTITFEVTVPESFNTMDTAEDCLNTVTVQGFTDVCSASKDNPCPERTADAKINVDVPRIECEKAVCADLLSDGSCDDDAGLGYTDELLIEGDTAEYPLSVIYRFTVTNTGETDFADARVCDATLIADLTSGISGLELGVCTLDSVSGCGSVGPLGNGDVGDPPSTLSATCTVKFLTEEAWTTMAELDDDGRQFCYSNRAHSEASVDPLELCTRQADLTVVSDDCRAQVCIEATTIPTVSEWGLVILTLLLLTAAKVHFGRGQTINA